MTTKTALLYRKQQLQRRADQIELQRCAESEFPIGTKVKYVHTYDSARQPKYRSGKVHGHGSWRVLIKSRTGAIHDKEPYLLEFDNEASLETSATRGEP